MHRALEIGFKMMEEKTQLASLQLKIGTHLDPLLEEEEQDFRQVCNIGFLVLAWLLTSESVGSLSKSLQLVLLRLP